MQRNTTPSLHLGAWTALGFHTTINISQNAKRSFSGSSYQRQFYELQPDRDEVLLPWSLEGEVYMQYVKNPQVWNVGGTIGTWFVTPVPHWTPSCSVEVLKGRHACFTRKRKISTLELSRKIGIFMVNGGSDTSQWEYLTQGLAHTNHRRQEKWGAKFTV